jgi:TRAP-type C4-dicarboxylate transport system permease small subunit
VSSPLVHPGRPLAAALVRRAEGLLGVIAALALFALMMLTCVDVLGRYLFSRPLPGGFELTELAMGALIFTALPLVTLRRQHVRVDLVEHLVPAPLQALQQALLDVVAALCMGVIAWRIWVRAEHMQRVGETTATLQIAVHPLVYYMAVMAAISALLIVVLAIADALGARNSQVADDS